MIHAVCRGASTTHCYTLASRIVEARLGCTTYDLAARVPTATTVQFMASVGAMRCEDPETAPRQNHNTLGRKNQLTPVLSRAAKTPCFEASCSAVRACSVDTSTLDRSSLSSAVKWSAAQVVSQAASFKSVSNILRNLSQFSSMNTCFFHR